MISGPPGFSAIVTGISYALSLATRRVEPSADAHPNGPVAISQAIWFRFMITVLNGVVILGFDNVVGLVLFFLIAAIDTMSYPVVSHLVLAKSGLGKTYPNFITGFTWVGNLRVLILMTISLLTVSLGAENMQIIMFPFAIWMIWASWSVATKSIGRGGWIGAGMVFLALILEMLLGAMIITFIHPTGMEG